MNEIIKSALFIVTLGLFATIVAMQSHTNVLPLADAGSQYTAFNVPDEFVQLTENRPATLEEFKSSSEYLPFMINNMWILIAAFMVLLMHLGFASLESGLTQAKNAVNVIYKNVFIICAGVIIYALIGFQLMYPGEFNGVLGFARFGIGFDTSDPVGMLTTAYSGEMTIWTDFIFQAMFAATAASIVSGCVTGRIKLSSFMIFGALLVAFCYPVTGSWVWGGGWLDELGFYDFAGSTLVHGVGAAAGLACVILLGARSGKFVNGKIIGIPAHNIPLATVGVFLLWIGWFGFNGGSVLSADPAGVSYVFVTTAISACSGALASMITTQLVMKSLDAPMALNGILAGLVGITAGADVVSVMGAATIGTIAGVLVVFSILMFDKLKIDDPVGAGSAGNDLYFELGLGLGMADLFVGAGDGWHSSDGEFEVVNVGLGVSKEIPITDTFSIPLSGAVVLNPHTEQFYIVVGVSF